MSYILNTPGKGEIVARFNLPNGRVQVRIAPIEFSEIQALPDGYLLVGPVATSGGDCLPNLVIAEDPNQALQSGECFISKIYYERPSLAANI